MKKNLLFIVGSLTMGGVETYISRLCSFLKDDYSLYVLNLTMKADKNLLLEISKNAEIVNFIDVTSYQIFARLNFSAINHSLPINFKALKEKIANIDYIHCVDSETNIVGLEISNYYNAKFITSSYHPLEYVWGNGFYFRMVQKKIIKNISESNIFFMNEAVKDKTNGHLGIKSDAKNIIPLGVNLDVYKDTTPSYESKKIVSVGRLVDFKTYNELMIKNIDLINKVNNENFEYHIYGDGILKNDLIDLAKCQKSEVIFHGTVDYDKLPFILNDAFVFVGIGTSIIESSAAGIPSIIGTGDYIKEGFYGYFSQYDNYLVGEECPECHVLSIEDIFTKLCKLDRGSYFDLSEEHRKKAKRFDIHFVAKSLINFLEKSSTSAVDVKYSKFRYFSSNLLWLFLNKAGLLRDRKSRYKFLV